VIEDDPFHRLGLAEYTVTQLHTTVPGAERFGAWIAAYERAWRTAGTATLGELFTEGASYRAGPFEEPVVGLGAIGVFWPNATERTRSSRSSARSSPPIRTPRSRARRSSTAIRRSAAIATCG
jgi:hypothetical protein